MALAGLPSYTRDLSSLLGNCQTARRDFEQNSDICIIPKDGILRRAMTLTQN